MPLEWSFAGARSRGVIGYGSIDRSAPARIRKVYALETLLTGVAPWPASDEAMVSTGYWRRSATSPIINSRTGATA